MVKGCFRAPLACLPHMRGWMLGEVGASGSCVWDVFLSSRM